MLPTPIWPSQRSTPQPPADTRDLHVSPARRPSGAQVSDHPAAPPGPVGRRATRPWGYQDKKDDPRSPAPDTAAKAATELRPGCVGILQTRSLKALRPSYRSQQGSTGSPSSAMLSPVTALIAFRYRRSPAFPFADFTGGEIHPNRLKNGNNSKGISR